MDPQTVEIAIKAYPEKRLNLEEAARIARAAEARANSGNVEKAIEVVLNR